MLSRRVCRAGGGWQQVNSRGYFYHLLSKYTISIGIIWRTEGPTPDDSRVTDIGTRKNRSFCLGMSKKFRMVADSMNSGLTYCTSSWAQRRPPPKSSQTSSVTPEGLIYYWQWRWCGRLGSSMACAWSMCLWHVEPDNLVQCGGVLTCKGKHWESWPFT